MMFLFYFTYLYYTVFQLLNYKSLLICDGYSIICMHFEVGVRDAGCYKEGVSSNDVLRPAV